MISDDTRRRGHLSRLETLEWLLATFNDAREPLQRGAPEGTPGKARVNESKLLLMPAAWTKGSYADLEEGLKDLRKHNRVLYWHVSERYLRCRSARINIVVERVTVTGTLVKEPRMVLVELWDPRVQLKYVREAVTWLEGHLGDLYLPKDLYELASS